MSPRTVLASTSLAIALAAVAANAQSTQQRVRHAPFSIVDESEGIDGFGPPGLPPANPNVFPNYTVGNASLNIGDGWPERYQWVEPIPAPTGPVPLLVIFHKYGTSELDMTVYTNFPQEVGNQGWYAICPLAANTQHFGSLQSQAHMEAALLDMIARFPLIDPSRIYGVGFSMGAGAVANYAARHVDPAKPMLAAMIGMSGGFALDYTYYCDPGARPALDFWYGNGTAGSADPFKMARSSTINFDPLTFQIYTNEDLARNITHVPLQIVHALDEKIGYLPTECELMSAHMQSLGAVPGSNFDTQIVPFGVDAYDHRWSMLDSHWACEWLKTKTLTLPNSARTLADHDGIYFRFFVEQDAPNAFTPFDWLIDTQSNALHLLSTSNLKRLTVDTLGAGLNPAAPIGVNLSTLDGLADQIVFTSVPAAPTGVTRDGNATTSWSYNATARELTLTEIDGLAHNWAIVP